MRGQQGAVAPVRGGDDRLAGRHRLGDDDPEALAIGRRGAGDVAGRIEAGRLVVGELSQEAHVWQAVASDIGP